MVFNERFLVAHYTVSDFGAEGPPVPIPNTEVKLCRGDNTWRATARENSASLTQVDPIGSAAVGVCDAEGPPVPIPNTEVKLCGGDNTCRATGREDSTMPTPPPNASLAVFAHNPTVLLCEAVAFAQDRRRNIERKFCRSRKT